jgi:uncharacterized protein
MADDPTAMKDSLVHFLFQSIRIHQTMISTSARVSNFRVSLLIVLVLMSSRPAFCGKIHEAVKKDDKAKVRKLIGLDPDLVFSKDKDGFTPLHLAAANGNKDIAEFLLTAKADVNSRDNAGSTPLHQAEAAKGDHADLVELLIEHRAEVDASDKHGLTPLHYGTLANNRNAVISLLNHAANVNVQANEGGATPLILAVGKGYKELVELLLAHGADVNLPDDRGTPLAWAKHAGHEDIAKLLGKQGGHE